MKKKSHFFFEMHCEYCTSKIHKSKQCWNLCTRTKNTSLIIWGFSPYCNDLLQQMCLLAPLLKVNFHILFSPVFCVFYFLCSVHLWSTANIQQTGTAGLANSHSLFEFIGSIPPDLQLIVHHWEGRDTLSSREVGAENEWINGFFSLCKICIHQISPQVCRAGLIGGCTRLPSDAFAAVWGLCWWRDGTARMSCPLSLPSDSIVLRELPGALSSSSFSASLLFPHLLVLLSTVEMSPAAGVWYPAGGVRPWHSVEPCVCPVWHY